MLLLPSLVAQCNVRYNRNIVIKTNNFDFLIKNK